MRLVAIGIISLASISSYTRAEPPAKSVPVVSTGQSVTLVAGDDGDLEAGVPLPTPRFIDQGDGTVLDALTDLIWLKDAGCLLVPDLWVNAFDVASAFNAGVVYPCAEYVAGTHNDWRVANIREYQSLVNYQFDGSAVAPPFLSNSAGTGNWSQGDPFYNVFGIGTGDERAYWSSTSPGLPPVADSRILCWARDGAFRVCGGAGGSNLIWLVRGPASRKGEKRGK